MAQLARNLARGMIECPSLAIGEQQNSRLLRAMSMEPEVRDMSLQKRFYRHENHERGIFTSALGWRWVIDNRRD